MSAINYTPRVQFADHQSYINQIVNIVGTIKQVFSQFLTSQLSDTDLILETPDRGSLQIRLSQHSKCTLAQVGQVVEITGRVDQDGSIQELSSCLFADPAYNPENYKKAMELVLRMKDVFGSL